MNQLRQIRPSSLEAATVNSGLLLSFFARDGRFQSITALVFVIAFALLAARARQDALVLPKSVIWVLLAWFLGSVAWTDPAIAGVRQGANLVGWSAVAVVASQHSLSWLVSRWYWAARVLLLLGLFVLLVDAGFGRSLTDSVFNSKNHAGFALAMSVVPVALCGSEETRNVVRLAVVGSAATAACIALNAQAGVVLAVAMVAAALLAGPLLLSRHSLAFLALAGGLIGVFATIVPPSSWLAGVAGFVGRDSSLSGRWPLWTAVWEQALERPLAGHGLGSVWSQPLEPPATVIVQNARIDGFSDPRLVVYAHNGFLDAFLQTGLIGLVLAILSILVVINRLGAGFRSARWDSYFDRRSLTVAFVGIVGVVMANLTETRIFNDAALLLLVAIGLTIQADHERRRNGLRGDQRRRAAAGRSA